MESNLSFSEALIALKNGQSVQRAGWNGKGMFIYLNKGSYDFHSKDGVNIAIIEKIEGVSSILFEGGDKDTVTRLPNLNMRSASGSTVTGWLASQTDLLAEDWQILN